MPGLKELRVAQPCPDIQPALELQEFLHDATVLGRCTVRTAKDINDALAEIIERAYTKGVREGRRLECADQLAAYANRFGFGDEQVNFDDVIKFDPVVYR